MTYNVLDGTLSLTQSINQSVYYCASYNQVSRGFTSSRCIPPPLQHSVWSYLDLWPL